MQAMVEESGRYYETLEKALDAAQKDQTIMLLEDINSQVYIKKSVTINLNGNGNGNNNITVNSGNTLTLDGSGEVGIVQSGYSKGTSGTTAEGLIGGALNVVSDKVAVSYLFVQQRPNPAMQLSKGTFYKIELSSNLAGKMTASELLADGYAFAFSNGDVRNGYVNLITNVKLIQHQHDTSAGTCVCGYTCGHKNVGADGKCTDCGMQQTAKLTWTDGETDKTDYAQNTDAAVQKVKALNGSGISDVTVTLLTDLDSEWVIADGGTFKLTTADGVALTKNITVEGETDVTVIGGTYGKTQSGIMPSGQFTITYRNNGKISLAGGGFYELDVLDDDPIYAPRNIQHYGRRICVFQKRCRRKRIRNKSRTFGFVFGNARTCCDKAAYRAHFQTAGLLRR